ncbi:MAG: class I SAM-dependent methyltransferase [Mycobacteriales bacterium]
MQHQHYFSEQPTTTSSPRDAVLALPDGLFRFATDTGVFSYGAVDAGTRLLLQHAPLPPVTGDLLDIGCGYGPIAVVWARRCPGARVWAIDVNQRARDLTVANAAAAGCGNVEVRHPDELPATARFAAIYANPPIKVGKAALHELLLTWLARLLPGGVAYLVVHRHLGSDSLADWLRGSEYTVVRERSAGGYRLLRVQPIPR